MSNADIPLRVIQKLGGHRSLAVLQEYLEVSDSQVRGAASSLSALGYVRKPRFTAIDATDSTPPLLGGQLAHPLSDD